MKKWIITSLFSLLLSLLFFKFTGSLTVGLALVPGEGGGVSLSYRLKEGQEIRLPAQGIEGGRPSFSLPADARHFCFHFAPKASPYILKGLTVGGVLLFPSRWLYASLTPREVLARGLREDGFLSFSIRDRERSLDYTRFFYFLPRLFRFLRIALVLLPWIWLPLFLAIRFFRRISVRDIFNVADPKFFWFYSGAVLLTFPRVVNPVKPGLDSSWIWMINKFPFKTYLENGMTFTYGPLGFLFFPQQDPLNIYLAFLVNLLFFILTGLILLFIRRRVSHGHLSSWLFLMLLFLPMGNMEWRWAFLGVASMAFAVLDQGTSRVSLAFAALAGALLPLVGAIKESELIIFATSHFLALAIGMVMRKEGMGRIILAYLLSLLVFSSILILTCFPSLTAFGHWLADSAEISSGYNRNMVVTKSWLNLLAPFFILGFISALLLFRRCERWKGALILLLFAPLFFALLKYALVRQGVTPMLSCTASLSAFSILFFKQQDSRLKYLCISLFLLLGGLDLPYCLIPGVERLPFSLNLRALPEILAVRENIERKAGETRAAFAGRELPAEWRERIGGEKLQFLPYNCDAAMVDSYRLQPMFTLQLYSVLTGRLDRESAERYRSSLSPRFIVLEILATGIDGSNLYLETPQVWEAVKSGYQLVDSTDLYMLLEKRGTPVPPEKVSGIRTLRVSPGEWVELPVPKGRHATLSLDWEPSLLGKLLTLFLRNTQTYVDLELDDGSHARYSITPENLAAPFPLDEIPTTKRACLNLFSGKEIPRIKRLRFSAETPFFYREQITLRLGVTD